MIDAETERNMLLAQCNELRKLHLDAMKQLGELCAENERLRDLVKTRCKYFRFDADNAPAYPCGIADCEHCNKEGSP